MRLQSSLTDKFPSTLDIKELTTAYGEKLHMRKTVEAYFDDRNDLSHALPPGEVPPTSIVQVHCYPTDTPQIQRYGSLMPESAARPRKRPLTLVNAQPPIEARAIASTEQRDDAERFDSPSKRRKGHQTLPEGRPTIQGSDRRDSPDIREHNQQSQASGSQASIHQVKDSQTGHAHGGIFTCLPFCELSHSLSSIQCVWLPYITPNDQSSRGQCWRHHFHP